MAPEQIQGDVEIDQRADLFAFGCVLYEMIAGKQAFGGETVLDTLHAIARTEPQPLGEIKPDLPAELHRSLRKCLAKDADRHYQVGDEIVVDLRQLSDDITAGVAVPVGDGQPVVAPAAVEMTRGIPWKLAAPIAVAIALLAALGVWIMIPSPPEPLITRFHIDYPPETTFQSLATLGVAISPDGRSVVFNGNRQLWLRAIDDPVATPIRGTEGARVPFFSPDGQQLGFWRADEQMKKVSITGGAPVSLGAAPVFASGASWADDGYIYFGQGAKGILRVSENGGEPEVVVGMEEGEQARGPQLLPGGEWLLFALRGSGSWWREGPMAATCPPATSSIRCKATFLQCPSMQTTSRLPEDRCPLLRASNKLSKPGEQGSTPFRIEVGWCTCRVAVIQFLPTRLGGSQQRPS